MDTLARFLIQRGKLFRRSAGLCVEPNILKRKRILNLCSHKITSFPPDYSTRVGCGKGETT